MKTLQEIKTLERIAEQSEGEESRRAMKELREINPTYHWCNEWDGAVICNNHPEWDSCICGVGVEQKQNIDNKATYTPEFEKLAEEIKSALSDAYNAGYSRAYADLNLSSKPNPPDFEQWIEIYFKDK